MGTGSALTVDNVEPTIKLAAIDEEKVRNIVEICDVSREEAMRVLDACHMDETMAIDRFLSGNGVSTWSKVSKKKKPAPSSRSASNARGNHGGPSYNRSHNHDRDRDRDRRDRDRSSHHYSDQSYSSNGYRRGSRHHPHHTQQPYSHKAARKSIPPSEKPSAETSLPHPEPAPQAWGKPRNDETWSDTKPNGTETWGDAPTTETWGEPSQAKPAAPSAPDSPWSGTPNAENTWAEASDTPDNAWGSEVTPNPPGTGAWRMQPPSSEVVTSNSESKPLEKESPAPAKQTKETPTKPKVISSSTVKRNFNYAAAAASGTSHAKTAPSVASEVPAPTPVIPAPTPVIPTPKSVVPAPPSVPAETDTVVSEHTEDVAAQESPEPQAILSIPSRNVTPQREHERPSHDTNGDHSLPPTNGLANETFEQRSTTVPVPTAEVRVESPSTTTSAWTTHTPTADPVEEKHLEETATAVALASAAVVGSEQNAGDSLSLQFGSFGLSGLDTVNWSASEQKRVEPSPSIVAASEPTSAPPPPAVPAASAAPNVPTSVPVEGGISSAPISSSASLNVADPIPAPTEQRPQNTVSNPLPTGSSATTGSGMFPMLPVGPGGNFPPPNYGAPYLMPPLHGYSLGSYDNAGDLGSSRAPNLGPPGSLPLYDPAALTPMGSGTAKYGGIPGLGDMNGLPAVPGAMGKEGLHGNGDVEKGSGLGTSALQAGMDPLATPYMMPGYPSMQYPMYTFPNAPYGPPGMGPPGPGPFPYPPGGQVSSQGGRGGFGFEDGSIGLGANTRSGSGLGGESMYTPGYLSTPMGHGGSQKNGTDGGYKGVRGSSHPGPGNSLGGMSMAGGIVHGMTYGDYGGMSGVSNGVSTNGAPGGWNNRQASGGRNDGSSGGMVSNQSMGGGSQNSTLYAAGPGGAPGGYWTPQQGGYYP
eukprot:GFKZ01001755.1.p1 GENE.GFKZ01001755.1~~GFKZ01001755.1.p1  ORF type:complete len:925 (+),score=98.90 GFKZ01001755.1:311-3085(+)